MTWGIARRNIDCAQNLRSSVAHQAADLSILIRRQDDAIVVGKNRAGRESE
jgi:hypothetical protein